MLRDWGLISFVSVGRYPIVATQKAVMYTAHVETEWAPEFVVQGRAIPRTSVTVSQYVCLFTVDCVII